MIRLEKQNNLKKMFSIILLFSAISLLGYAFYKWATLNNDYFLKKGVAFKKPTFLLGSSGKMMLRKLPIADYVKWQYNLFPDKKYVLILLF